MKQSFNVLFPCSCIAKEAISVGLSINGFINGLESVNFFLSQKVACKNVRNNYHNLSLSQQTSKEASKQMRIRIPRDCAQK